MWGSEGWQKRLALAVAVLLLLVVLAMIFSEIMFDQIGEGLR